tara:strand:+ start:381 stop:731 length:351 start_codon:yes stop_codon:yes gene_type:complete
VSDIRFIIIGAGLIFAGIIVLSVFGSEFVEITLQAEFGECYDYHDNAPPTEIDCEIAFQNKLVFFALVTLLIICGSLAMIKGIRGTWDQDVKPEDMVGPGSSFDTRDEPKDSDKTD